MFRSALCCLLLGSLTGCSLFNTVHVDAVGTSYQKPSNVAAYVAVSDGDRPITELSPESFAIYENEQRLSSDDTHQVLLPRELAAYHHTVLLVDVSGQSGSSDVLARAAATFVETTRKKQPVSVFAYGGGSALRPSGEFGKSADAGAVDLRALSRASSEDSSRNLNGAVVSGLKELDARLAAQPKALKVGTLVVFMRGPDLAGRVPEAELNAALSQTEHAVLAVGIGERAGRTLANVGKSGTLSAPDDDSLGIVFEKAAQKAGDLLDKYYLIAYCSPARSGWRRLKIEAHFRNADGNDLVGTFSDSFDATGFGPGCRADSVPRFVPRPKPAENHAPSKSTDTKPANADASQPPPPPSPPPGDDDAVVAPPNKPGYSH